MDEHNQNNNPKEPELTNDQQENLQETELNTVDQPVFIPDQTRDEETATEMDVFDDDLITDPDEHDRIENPVSSIPGWIGLALSILSFFMMPIIIGGIAIIVGFIARNRGAEWLGNTAIAIGVISIVVRMFFLPFA